MVKDAEANAAEDKKKVELVTAKNQADGLVHSVQEEPHRVRRQAGGGREGQDRSRDQGSGRSHQGRRQGRAGCQERGPDDGQPEARREDVRRPARRRGCRCGRLAPVLPSSPRLKRPSRRTTTSWTPSSRKSRTAIVSPPPAPGPAVAPAPPGLCLESTSLPWLSKRDYYEVLGLAKGASETRSKGLPQAGHEVPP